MQAQRRIQPDRDGCMELPSIHRPDCVHASNTHARARRGKGLQGKRGSWRNGPRKRHRRTDARRNPAEFCRSAIVVQIAPRSHIVWAALLVGSSPKLSIWEGSGVSLRKTARWHIVCEHLGVSVGVQ